VGVGKKRKIEEDKGRRSRSMREDRGGRGDGMRR
jgi:hypothetical protein